MLSLSSLLLKASVSCTPPLGDTNCNTRLLPETPVHRRICPILKELKENLLLIFLLGYVTKIIKVYCLACISQHFYSRRRNLDLLWLVNMFNSKLLVYPYFSIRTSTRIITDYSTLTVNHNFKGCPSARSALFQMPFARTLTILKNIIL
jgi:hypothetical protein